MRRSASRSITLSTASPAALLQPQLARADGRVQAQDRPVAHLQARRRAEGDHAKGRPAASTSASALPQLRQRRRDRPWLLPSAVPARPPSSVAKPPAAAASAAPVAPVEPPKPAPRFITPQSVARPPATITIPAKPAAVPPAVRGPAGQGTSQAGRTSRSRSRFPSRLKRNPKWQSRQSKSRRWRS